MKLKDTLKIQYLSAVIFFISIATVGYAQTFFGVKAGANANKISFENDVYKDYYSTKIRPGFTAGAVFLIENKEKYGLYTELLYSMKGKHVVSRANDYESHRASYHYVDLPIMFRVRFNQPKFSWFLQLGPEVNYWLGGKGVFEKYEPDRDIITRYEYEINFDDPKNEFGYMNVQEENRLQIGLALGGGLIWKLKNANYLALDMRFSYGHTYMGGFESGSIPNIGLFDNFEHTNNVLSVSAVYYFDILEKVRLSKNKYRKN